MSTPGVTLEQFRHDLRTYADLAEVEYDPAVMDPVLETLADLWTTSVVGVRTTTHPVAERELNVRMMHSSAPDLVPRLRKAGLLTYTGHPMEQLLTAVGDAVPVAWGVDVAVASGVQKIWTVFPELVPVTRMLEFPGMPDSARAHAAHLDRYGGEIGIMALDFASRTMNLYSKVFAPGELPPDEISRILADLDFVPASEKELRLLTGTFNLYRTFSWTSPRMRRICFPLRCDIDNFPTHLHPVLDRFVKGAPYSGPGRPKGLVFYVAYGPDDRYYKVQVGYTDAIGATYPGGTVPQMK
ncbi:MULTISPECIES: aromatic prenyltransferase [unclassified Nocardia]|uniref:aromatic prenyltransferase n=1 Tax=unclassified Nocardia TaxID=2637762 RepID=UPI001CE441F9|nr:MULTISPECIES: aromatic prenyltransferase [unclassified Nocardia]